MNVASKKEFDIKLTDEEKSTLISAKEVIKDLVKTMEEYHCNTVDTGWPDSPTYITIENLNSCLWYIGELYKTHTMLNDERSK